MTQEDMEKTFHIYRWASIQESPKRTAIREKIQAKKEKLQHIHGLVLTV
jgi:hypothetical protein